MARAQERCAVSLEKAQKFTVWKVVNTLCLIFGSLQGVEAFQRLIKEIIK
jgi:hypothetical protein